MDVHNNLQYLTQARRKTYPEDKSIAQLAITTLSHCMSAILEGESPADPKLFASRPSRLDRANLLLKIENVVEGKEQAFLDDRDEKQVGKKHL